MTSDTYPEMQPQISASTPSSSSSSEKGTPSLLAANLFLLLGLCIIIFSSELFSDPPTLHYIISILAEILLSLIAIAFAAMEKLPLRKTLRLQRTGWRPIALSVVLGVGFWIAGVIINAFTALIFGYVTPVTPDIFPTNALEAILFFIMTVIVAPICEEIMFRGYVQRAYERRGAWLGILITGIIFATYHLRFQGVFALLPVAMALGFVAWRSESLLPTMVMHAVYNALATLLLIAASFLPLQTAAFIIGFFVCVALLTLPLLFVVLWRLWRLLPAPASPYYPPLSGWRRWAWSIPLTLVYIVYGYAAISEVILGRFPELLAVEAVELEVPASWESRTRWTYTINNLLGESLGEAECVLLPQETYFTMECQADYEAFQLDLPLSVPNLSAAFDVEARTYHHQVAWDRRDLRLYALAGEETENAETVAFTLSSQDGTPSFFSSQRVDTELSEVEIPANAFIEYEWPWRLMGLPFEIGYGSYVPFFYVDTDGTIFYKEAYLLVELGEPIWTPAGNFVTWKVTLTYEIEEDEVILAAWYNAQAPHTLVRYDDGEVSYVLRAIQK
ncbi:MAG: CPBP family intramembrane metalloprotease [Anaerolineae bacterium]|nr:CPBP family intramembrane metalloprotease [Anaerolineae bacterium]